MLVDFLLLLLRFLVLIESVKQRLMLFKHQTSDISETDTFAFVNVKPILLVRCWVLFFMLGAGTVKTIWLHCGL